ncbi:hypothetical protein PDESU_02197 [Pontiella desulfatans]|uniref:Autotransporter domain-containing protein n=1 Tax=Pontiella desulfatans TaxID=2750659 RepID=A0A6C2U0Z7_PONDE|nr:hypothetical protein [Pontiella desulfatans]VGO13640.1 hypothetical protein PDESU_02197 [Pontiella desulfatans]
MKKQITWFGFAVLFCAATASAELVRYYDVDPGTDNLWTNTLNWQYKPDGSWTNYGKLPESDDQVIITYGDSVEIDAAGLAVANDIDLGKYSVPGNLTTTSDGTLTTTADIVMNGSIKQTGYSEIGDPTKLINYGTNTIGTTLNLALASNLVYNAGQFTANAINLASAAEVEAVDGGVTNILASTALFTNDVTGVVDVTTDLTLADGVNSVALLENLGDVNVVGDIETMGNGQATINNSGLMQSVSNNINIGANTVVNNSGTMTAKVDFDISGGTVVNDGTISTLASSSAKSTSGFGDGFSFENTMNGLLDLGWNLKFDAGTFTNRGTLTTTKAFFMGYDANGGELTVYNAAGATNIFSGSVEMGRIDGSAEATLINEGYFRAGSTGGLQMKNETQTIQNKADGYIQAGILKTAMQADSLSVISNEGWLNVSRSDPYGYFASVAGTTMVHNAASGTFSVAHDMTLSEQATAFTSITNFGTMTVGSDLYLAVEGDTEFAMLGGTLDVDGTLVLTNGGTGHVDLMAGTVTAADIDLLSDGSCTIDISEGAELIVNADRTTELNGMISDGYITGSGGATAMASYDGTNTTLSAEGSSGDPLVIESGTMNGSGEFEVVVSGLSSGTTYYLWRETDLTAAPSFTNEVASIAATSDTETLTDTAPPAANAFYKVTD